MSEDGTPPDARLDELLRVSTPGFEEGFADRVLARVEGEQIRRESVDVALQRHFVRVAPFALAASLALAAFNVSRASGDTGQTVFEAMFGLEPVTLQSAYTVAVPGADTMEEG